MAMMPSGAWGAPMGAPGFNKVHEVRYRGGLIGLFAGENEEKALKKVILDLNQQGRMVAGLVIDRWSFWRRLLWALIFFITLTFYTRGPNVLVVSAPIPVAAPPPIQPPPPPPAAILEPPAAPTLPAARPMEMEPTPAPQPRAARPRPAARVKPDPSPAGIEAPPKKAAARRRRAGTDSPSE